MVTYNAETLLILIDKILTQIALNCDLKINNKSLNSIAQHASVLHAYIKQYHLDDILNVQKNNCLITLKKNYARNIKHLAHRLCTNI